MRESVIIYGAGLFGQQIAAWLNNHFSDQYEIVGFAVDTPVQEITVNEIESGNPNIIGSLEDLSTSTEYSPEANKLVLAIGYSDMSARLAAYERAVGLGYRFITLVHPNACVESDTTIGDGSIICSGAIIDVLCKLGPANFVDIGVLVGERVITEAGNYISAGAIIGGNSTIGKGNFFGLSAVVRNDVNIGNYNYIPVQGLLHQNIGDNSQLMEARTIRVIS